MLPERVTRVLALLLACTIAAAARKPGEPPKPGWNLFSRQQDVQLGQEAASQVKQQFQVVQNQSMQDYLKRVGQRLAATSPARDSGFPFNFTLVNQPEINAFALPGGPMFVFTGVFKVADNEAQLAGVMAHEMSHVILRHGTNQASKANLIQLPALLAGAVVGNGSLLGQLAQAGVGLGANSVLLKFSRDAESQADAMGAQMMSEAGYNPIEMARFFEKLEGSAGARGPQFLSDHPNPGNRVKAVEAEVQAMPRRTYGADVGGFDNVKREVAGLPAPPKSNPQGVPAAPPQGAPPSQGWKELRGQAFTVSYPAGWEVFGDKDSAMATIAPREGIVQGRGGHTQIGYGVMLSYYSPRGQSDLRSATGELINQLQAGNATMQAGPGSQKSARVGGSDALVNVMRSSSPYGGAETDAVVTVARPEGLFYLVFIAPEKNFDQLEKTFSQMLDSLRFAR
jgi:beta-barrel assembly-enhancing protease